jgi:ParB family transcriptional regulator, chromosome partitioning protein
MARLQDLEGVGRADLFKIDPRIIKVAEGFNVRADTEALRQHIEELAASISENGVQSPLVVRFDGTNIYVCDGHNRLAATKLAIERGVEIESVPCIAEPKFVSEIDRVARLITANSGKPLEPVEKAEVCKRLLNLGLDPDAIGKKLGIGGKQVTNLLTLSTASVEVKEMVSAGEVSATTALRAIQAEGNTAATETLKEAVATAKASGKAKATPKTIAAVKPPRPAPSKPTNFSPPQPKQPVEDDDEVENTTPARAPTPIKAAPPPMVNSPVMTPAKFRQLVETIHTIRQSNDVKLIHAMCDDALRGRSAA